MEKRRSTLLVIAFILFFTLLHFPMLAVFNQRTTVFKVPLLFLSLFVIWGLMIVVLRFILEMRDGKH